MRLEEYICMDAVALAEQIRSRQTDPIEVLSLCTKMIEMLDPKLNIMYYKAYKEAKEQIDHGFDVAAPFAGVPLLVKDSGGNVDGFPYSAGSRLIEGSICHQDTALIKRLKKACFVILGSTKTPECCYTNTTESVLHGATRNPWDPDYSTGGSSGGSAAAVASRMVPVAHGSDGGGSIREPSSCCGVVGYKPSRFRISGAPGSDDMLSGLVTNFCITRSVRDIKQILYAVSGVDAGYYGTQPPFKKKKVHRSLRIACMRRYPLGGNLESAECLDALDKTVKLLQEMGHTVEEAYPVVDPRIHWARGTIQSVYIAQQLDAASQSLDRPINSDYVEDMILYVYQKGKTVRGEEFVLALDINNQISRSMGAFMERYDLIVCPTMGSLPPKIGDIDSNVHPEWDYANWTTQKSKYTHFTNLFNATGQPSISIPLFQSESGLPIGIELSGRIGEDELVLSLAGDLEKRLSWEKRVPELVSIAGFH